MTGLVTRRSVLLATAAGLTACGGADDVPRPQSPASDTAAPYKRRSTGRRDVAPARLVIPTLGLSTALITLGQNEDGTVEVPIDPSRAGWFRLGTIPGDRGSSVILGHVDSPDGPAVFADLASMRRSDRVEVEMSDGSLVAFEVDRVATYPNADFPANLVYADTRRVRGLNLVTCGGEYDRDKGGYQANVVVFTHRLSE